MGRSLVKRYTTPNVNSAAFEAIIFVVVDVVTAFLLGR